MSSFRHVPKLTPDEIEKLGLTPDEVQMMRVLNDPVEFAEVYFGWKARPHQKDLLRDGSLRQVVRIGRRGGKCLDASASVLTEQGPIRAEDLCHMSDRPAILTFNEKTFRIEVTENYRIWSNGNKPIFELKTQSGRLNRITGNHPFFVKGGDGSFAWVEAKDIKPGQLIAVPATYKDLVKGRSIGLQQALDFGSAFRQSPPSRVPAQVLSSTKEEILAFLGAYSGIGTAFVSPEHIAGRCLFCPGHELARDIQHLLLRLGLTFSRPSPWIIKVEQDVQRDGDIMWDEVVSIEPSGHGETYDLNVPGNHTLIADDIISHNTDCLCIKALYLAFVNGRNPDVKGSRGFVCLVITPEEAHVEKIFKRMRELIDSSPEYKASVKRHRQSPQVIELYNGSEILGFTAGTRSGAAASSVRGQRADWIFLDEADYLSDDDINTILPIAAEDPDRIGIWASSTPTGRRNFFYSWCMNGRLPDGHPKKIWKEIYHPSPEVIPNWGPRIEAEFRAMFPIEAVYRREVLAEFGDEAHGVYPAPLVDEALKLYDYSLDGSAGIRTMGVDWDKEEAGPEILVLEAMAEGENVVFKTVWRESIPRSKYAMSTAVDRVVELDAIFNPQHIYVDKGAGDMQVEQLQLRGVKASPGELGHGIDKKVRGIRFNQNITLREPASGRIMTKDAKAFMVSLTQVLLEQRKIHIPDSDNVLYRQMIEYNAHITKAGNVTYVKGRSGDHALDALHLAVLAFACEKPELMGMGAAVEVLRQIGVSKGPIIPRRTPVRSWVQPISPAKPASDDPLQEGQGWVKVNSLQGTPVRGRDPLYPSWGARGSRGPARRRSF